MKHWIITIVLLATFLLGGCDHTHTESEKDKVVREIIDLQMEFLEKQGDQIVENYGEILQNRKAIKELQNREE